MEAEKQHSAQEERRRKLQEYLAEKGKLKPQNNQKPYLRDTTNLPNKRQQPLHKQVFQKKKDIPIKVKSDPNKNTKTSANGPLQSRPGTGKISAQKIVSYNRDASQALAKNPFVSKPTVSRARSDQAVQSKNEDPKNKLAARKSSFTVFKTAEKCEQPDIGLTVILNKIQDGDKSRISDVHIVDPSLGYSEVPSQTKQKNKTQTRIPIKKPPLLHQALKPKSAPYVTKAYPSVGKPVPTTSAGHIRIVSRVNQPVSKNGNATERSFLIKSSRNNGAQPKRQQTASMEQVKSRVQKLSCITKLNPITHSAPVQKNISSGTISAAKTGKYSSSNISKKETDVQCRRSISKPAVWQTSTGPVVYNKPAGPHVSSNNRAKGANCKQMPNSATYQGQCTGKATSSCKTDSGIPNKPITPKMTVEDRRKKLQEWLSSKGKTYKRPPMTLPPKRPTTAKKKTDVNQSVWEGIEEEEELLLLSEKITQTLCDCLELIDKGVSAEEIHAALDKVPEGNRFAKYWICKAKLLEREGTFDVAELYKQGVQCGAMPIDELREVVFDIMKNANKKSKVVTFGPLPPEELAEDVQKDTRWHATPGRRPEDEEDLDLTVQMCDQGSAVKFQVACISSKKKKKRDGSSQEWKCLTPVRRSLRIHQSASQYPEVVQEHDTVVTCLNELLDMADTESYLYVRNEALPEEADHTILGMVKQDSTEEQNKRPV
ncbi:cytoskeleton-associated protein 2-like [Gastrophryne carolinensis]